jgi:NAD(P)-dependent dehydrogenase (short-subunit alcohol dehydrogenase family)
MKARSKILTLHPLQVRLAARAAAKCCALRAATARLFAEAGARVVVTYGNDAEAADRLVASLPGTGHRASRTPAQDTGAIEPAAAIGRMAGRLDILVNNAGSTRVIPHADLRASTTTSSTLSWRSICAGRSPRCAPATCCSRRAARARRQCRLGVGRAAARNIAYAAAKAGLHTMTMRAGAGIGARDPGRRHRPEPDGDADDPDVTRSSAPNGSPATCSSGSASPKR